MGIRDRLNAAKRHLWSPMTIDLLDRGSDPVVRAGRTARVVAEIAGEDDGSMERAEIVLTLNHRAKEWPLAELPPTVGRHELEVEIPADAPPATSWTEYRFVGRIRRTKGTPAEGVSPVELIGDPAHVFWPDGPRSGADGPTLSVDLDAETAQVGGAISGRTAPGATVEVGAFVDHVVGMEGRPNGVHKQEFRRATSVVADAAGAFTATLPDAGPPTFHDGDTASVVWEARVTHEGASAWRRFALLDPEGVTFPDRRRTSPALLDLFT